MATFRVTGGALSGVMMSGDAGIDNTLPEGPGGPVDPGWGNRPPIGGTLPEPPPGVWPPLTGWAPIQPAPPGTPPGAIWPPIAHPGHPLPPSPGHPDAGLPPSPGHPAQPLPPSPGHPSGGPVQPPGSTLPAKIWWVVVGIPGVGWRYAAIDPSLDAGMPLPPTPEPKG